MSERVLHLRAADHGRKREATYGFCRVKAPKRGTVEITDFPTLVTCRRCLAKLRAIGGSFRRHV